MSISPLQDAADLIKEGNVVEAIHLLKRLTEVLPGYAAAYVVLAHALEATSQSREAFTAWQHAALLIPNSRVIQQGLFRTADALSTDASTSPEAPLPPLSPPTAYTTEQIIVPPVEPQGSSTETTESKRESDKNTHEKPSQNDSEENSQFETPLKEAPSWQWPETLLKKQKSGDESDKNKKTSSFPNETESDIASTSKASQTETDVAFPQDKLELEQTFLTETNDTEKGQSQDETPDHTSSPEQTAPDSDFAPLSSASESTTVRPEDTFRTIPSAAVPEGAQWFDDLDSLITELESARIVPKPDFESVPPPDLKDNIEDMVSETLARIYASQKQYEEAARVYEQLAEQQPEEAEVFLAKAEEMRNQ